LASQVARWLAGESGRDRCRRALTGAHYASLHAFNAADTTLRPHRLDRLRACVDQLAVSTEEVSAYRPMRSETRWFNGEQPAIVFGGRCAHARHDVDNVVERDEVAWLPTDVRHVRVSSDTSAVSPNHIDRCPGHVHAIVSRPHLVHWCAEWRPAPPRPRVAGSPRNARRPCLYRLTWTRLERPAANA